MTQIAFIGNLTSPPELRYTQSGKAVANVTVAVNRKKGDVEETDFHRVTVWEGMAENLAQLDKGTRVVVVGRITQREYQTKEGEKRTAWEVTADAIGPDLRFAQVTVTRTQSGRGPGSPVESAEAEPWATTAPGTGFDAQTASWGSDSDSTPF